MPPRELNATTWREKRQHQTIAKVDPKKRAKANRERFRRQKTGAFRRANEIFVDGSDTGRDRRIYVLIMDITNGKPRYATYNSHPECEWVPAADEVAGHWPRPEEWYPSSFGAGPKTNSPSTPPSQQPQNSVPKTPVISHIIPRVRAPIFCI